MKTTCMLVCVFIAVSAFAAVDINKPIAEMKLKDGRTLRNVEIVSINAASVMAKWEGGRGTISKEAMPSEIASQLPGPAPKPPEAPSTPAYQGPTRKIAGQMYEKDHDKGGAFKFIDSSVKAYPAEKFATFKRTQMRVYGPVPPNEPLNDEDKIRKSFSAAEKDLPIVASARTDAEGRFELEIPAGQRVFVVGRGLLRYKGISVLRVWAVEESGTATSMNLSGDNLWQQWYVKP